MPGHGSPRAGMRTSGDPAVRGSSGGGDRMAPRDERSPLLRVGENSQLRDQGLAGVYLGRHEKQSESTQKMRNNKNEL